MLAKLKFDINGDEVFRSSVSLPFFFGCQLSVFRYMFARRRAYAVEPSVFDVITSRFSRNRSPRR